MEMPWTKRQGRPRRLFLDVMKEGMRALGVTNEDAMNHSGWRMEIRGADP